MLSAGRHAGFSIDTKVKSQANFCEETFKSEASSVLTAWRNVLGCSRRVSFTAIATIARGECSFVSVKAMKKGFWLLFLPLGAACGSHSEPAAWPSAPAIVKSAFKAPVVEDLFDENPRYSSIGVRLDTTPDGEVLHFDATMASGDVDHVDYCPGQDPASRLNGRPAPEPWIRDISFRYSKAACAALSDDQMENDLRNGLELKVVARANGYAVRIKPTRLVAASEYEIDVDGNFNVFGNHRSHSKNDLKSRQG
jgi:hypothetical protein